MKIPKSVKIGAYTYRVKYEKSLKRHKLGDVNGICDNEGLTIWLVKGMVGEQLKITFLHECLHAIESVYGFELGEERVSKLDHTLTAFLIDNNLGFK